LWGGHRPILPLIVGYIVLVERKLMADMQAGWDPCAWVRTDYYSPSQTR